MLGILFVATEKEKGGHPGVGWALTARPWCSLGEHKQFHTNIRQGLVTMKDQEKKTTPKSFLNTDKI